MSWKDKRRNYSGDSQDKQMGNERLFSGENALSGQEVDELGNCFRVDLGPRIAQSTG